jgi:glycogen debranching enzyme
MTILAIKAIEEYNNLSGLLAKNNDSLKVIADNLRTGLDKILWDNNKKYLMNYFEDGTQDTHYYMGSLLAAHFKTISNDKITAMVETAGKKLLDPAIGLYTVYPMDFQNLGDYLKLVGNEAGDPHKYINGGVWPHSNAMYALALIAAGKKQEAAAFIKKTMTIDGIINSPNGQPAMYEYRNSNKDNPAEYGKVDKPQFMWAAGWYLYCIYELYGEEL